MSTITIDSNDIDSLANALGEEVTTLELLSNWLGVELIDGCLVLDEAVYADDGNFEDSFPAGTKRLDAAKAYVARGDWHDDDSNTTSWVTVYTYRKGLNAVGVLVHCDEETHTIPVDPIEPKCLEGEHDWQSPYSIVGGRKENPGVFGHAGGVFINEVCMKCGCGKQTDTYATNPANGEQGLRSVTYFPDKYELE